MIGHGSPGVQEGDVVCIFRGGILPSALRPQGARFTFHGECYVDGIMQGEAAPKDDDGWQIFEME